MSKPDFEEVHNAVMALQAKYPMVYIGSWYPEDFEQAAGNYDDEKSKYTVNIDYSDAKYAAIVESLHDTHDANVGVNWDVIKQVYEEVEQECS